MHTNTSALAPAYSLGDAGELRALLESASFTDVEMTVRFYVVREPATTGVVAGYLAVSPGTASIGTGGCAALAKAVEREIAPALQDFGRG